MKFLSFLLQRRFFLLGFFSIAVATWEAWKQRWLCDDAFFTFIYSRNLLEGNGFVFQFGEKVEGITNFLWSIFLCFSGLLGFSFPESSLVLGVLFYFFLLLWALFLESKRFPFASYPVFTLGLCFFPHFQIFATSGLETMAFAFFIFFSATVLQVFPQSFIVCGLATGLAGLLRPEGFLWMFRWSFSLSLQKELPVAKRFQVFGIPFMILSGMTFFRFFYFGSFFPNTFAAKSGFYPKEGLLYFFQIFQIYPLLVFPFLLFGAHLIFKRSIDSITYALWILWTVSIGGDFMSLRFWVPILPGILWISYQEILEVSQRLQIQSERVKPWEDWFYKNSNLVLLIFLSSVFIQIPLHPKSQEELEKMSIVEESLVYKKELLKKTDYDLDAWKGLRVAFFGAQAHFIYYMRPEFALESESGLTDSILAHRPNQEGARAGHRKPARYQDMVDRDIDLVLSPRFPEKNLPPVYFLWRGQSLPFYARNPERVKQALCGRPQWDCSVLYSLSGF